MFIDFGATFFNVIENAEPKTIFQSGKAMPVVSYKLLSGMTQFFQAFNVYIGKQHFSFFTTYSAQTDIIGLATKLYLRTQ